MSQVDFDAAREYFMELQDRICDALEDIDSQARFQKDEFPGDRGGTARPRVLEGGPHLEKAAVNFSHTVGESLPAAATADRPHLAGLPFQAVSISLIVHPRNPYAPTSHMNLRLFAAGDPSAGDVEPTDSPTWWFGGGLDLTPFYGFEEDCVHWHRAALAACTPFGEDRYERFKDWCDKYFYLEHRKEPRGIGGLFFDDLNEAGFDREFEFVRSVGDHYLPAYLPILQRRVGLPWNERERDFQSLRRGRYVEFNLVYDRGTLYGLQSKGRIESILASLPPLVQWSYDPQFDPDSPEARLHEDFLRPRDWVD